MDLASGAICVLTSDGMLGTVFGSSDSPSDPYQLHLENDQWCQNSQMAAKRRRSLPTDKCQAISGGHALLTRECLGV